MEPVAGKWLRRELRSHLEALGVEPGDVIMLHAALRRVGPMVDGPDALIAALLDTVGPAGTLLVYTNWETGYETLVGDDGLVPPELQNDIAPFDARSSRASRSHGAIAEFFRTWPGTVRSENPGASVAALGALAEWIVADHPLDYGYAEGSPFAKLVEAEGKVLMAGAPWDAMSLLHHAEHIARIPGKRVVRTHTPLLIGRKTRWRVIEEFDTCDPVVDGLEADYFRQVVEEYVGSGARARQGRVGFAPSLLVPAREIVAFAVSWLEGRFGHT